MFGGNTWVDCDHAVTSVLSVSPCSNNSSTQPVGSKPLGASPYGAMDMSGNAWEWVEDDYHDAYTSAPIDGTAWIDTPRGSQRVLRGGSWFDFDTKNLRVYRRIGDNPTNPNNEAGFRCAQ